MSINMERVAELTEIESKRLNERTKGSGDMYRRASHSLSGGVASSYQLREPWPIYLERGGGAEGLGRRRQRDVGLPQWLRVHASGTCPPGDR